MGASIWSPNSTQASGGFTRITYDIFNATPGQTAFTLVNATASPGTNNLFVAVDGVLYPFDEYTVTGSKSFTLDQALTGSETVFAYTIEANILGAPLSAAQFADLLTQVNNTATEVATSVATAPGIGSTNMEVIAHRGFVDQFPQNTLLAMSAARRRGATSLEADVRVSSNGVPILYHDSNLNTLTTGAGDPATVTLAYIQGVSFTALAGTPFSTTRIPTFLAFLNYARSQNLYVYPEIKAYRTQADVALIVADVVTAKMERLCMLTSFVYSDLTFVRAINPTIAVGFIGASFITDYQFYVDSLVDVGRAALVWDLADLILRPAIVTYAQAAGIDVIAYTMNSTDDALAAARVGVRRVISDVSLES